MTGSPRRLWSVTFFGAKGARLENWSTDLVLTGRWPYGHFFGAGGIQDKQLHIKKRTWFLEGRKSGGKQE